LKAFDSHATATAAPADICPEALRWLLSPSLPVVGTAYTLFFVRTRLGHSYDLVLCGLDFSQMGSAQEVPTDRGARHSHISL